MRLLIITPGDGRDLGPWLEALPSVRWLIREPDLARSELHRLLTLAPGRVWLHDKTPGARELAAERRLPLHLPSGAPQPSTGRWGRSCHSAADLADAERQGASWTLLSPVWSPTSKPGDTRQPLAPDGFLHLARGRRCFALGGITPPRAQRLVAGGAHGIAVCGDIFRYQYPQDAAKHWQLTAA